MIGADRLDGAFGDLECEDWTPRAGPTVFAPFAESTEKLPPAKQRMPNFRVRDLDTILAQLRAAGVAIEDELGHDEGVGLFAWLSDSRGQNASSYGARYIDTFARAEEDAGNDP